MQQGLEAVGPRVPPCSGRCSQPAVLGLHTLRMRQQQAAHQRGAGMLAVQRSIRFETVVPLPQEEHRCFGGWKNIMRHCVRSAIRLRKPVHWHWTADGMSRDHNCLGPHLLSG